MTPRPQGYREPTDEEMEKQPEGTLIYSSVTEQWVPSISIGLSALDDKVWLATPISPASQDANKASQALRELFRIDPLTGGCQNGSDQSADVKQASDSTPARYSMWFKGVKIDPYRINLVYGITNPGQQHAIKKLLRAGKSDKSYAQDISEARDALNRILEMLKEDEA